MSHSDHKWTDRVKTFLRNLRDAQTNVLRLNDQQIRIAELQAELRDERYRAEFLEQDNRELMQHVQARPLPLFNRYYTEASVEDTEDHYGEPVREITFEMRPIAARYCVCPVMGLDACRPVAEQMAKDTAEVFEEQVYHSICDAMNIPEERR